MKEEVSSEEMSMNQLDNNEKKLLAKHVYGTVFGDDGGTTSLWSEPCIPEVTDALARTTTTTSGFRYKSRST
jgi:hypothetical protein